MNATTNEPIHLTEDGETGDRFLVYGSKDGMKLDVRFEGETLWMTQAQIAELFGVDRTSATKHIKNIFEEEELTEATSVKKLHTSHGRPAAIYNLDVIISVGYRISSRQATEFRKWATQTLVQFAKKGFVVDAVRLKNPEYIDRIKELREIIRDIRSDEANVYRELRQICAMCQDYESGSKAALEFYKFTQAKLIYAVVSKTPAEVVFSRADRAEPNMGLQTWPNENIRKNDVTVSKNYLVEAEIRELNRLTTILLDIFEDQLDLGRLSVMDDVRNLLDGQLTGLGRVVLRDGGRVSKKRANSKAEKEFSVFKHEQKRIQREAADAAISELAKEAKAAAKRDRGR